MDLFLSPVSFSFSAFFSERSPRERRSRTGSSGANEKGAGRGEGGKNCHCRDFCAIGSLFPLFPVPCLLQMCRSVRLVMFILHYTWDRSQLQWDHPYKCHLTYTVIVLLNSDPAHSLILKPNWTKDWGHSCTQTHTDNLSKHTYSPENNYWRRIGANRRTQRQRHCHACRENNNCVRRWHPCCTTDHINTV